jgi:serine protease Do
MTQATSDPPAGTVTQAIRHAAEQVGPAVVGLGRGWGLGSGVVVGRDQVLTSAHNLRGREAVVTFLDGRRATAEVPGVEPDLDLAVLFVDTAGVDPVAWKPGHPETTIGTPVLALSNPGGRGLRVTPGLVASTGRSFRGLRGRRLEIGIEHTAPLPRGSSGGPLLDLSGALLGLNTLRLEGGLVLAVAADRALHRRVELIGRGQARAPRRLGVAIALPRAARRMRRAVGLAERDGLLVRAVEEGSPAAQAGIEAGDLMVAAGDRPLDDLEPLHAVLDEIADGDTLRLRVVRGEDERDVVVTFGEVTGASRR